VTLGRSASRAALAFAALAAVAMDLPAGWVAGLALAGGSLGGGFSSRVGRLEAEDLALRKLGFFRDRCGDHGPARDARRVGGMETVTLSKPDSWPT